MTTLTRKVAAHCRGKTQASQSQREASAICTLATFATLATPHATVQPVHAELPSTMVFLSFFLLFIYSIRTVRVCVAHDD